MQSYSRHFHRSWWFNEPSDEIITYNQILGQFCRIVEIHIKIKKQLFKVFI